jgi:hypothetical protein
MAWFKSNKIAGQSHYKNFLRIDSGYVASATPTNLFVAIKIAEIINILPRKEII